MKKLLENYINKGILPEKIVVSNNPSICLWSLSRNCLVGENGNTSSIN